MSDRPSAPLPPDAVTRAREVMATCDLADDPDLLRVLSLSPYAATVAGMQTDWLRSALADGSLGAAPDFQAFDSELREALSSCDQIVAVKSILRRMRNRMQFRIVWRHIAGGAPLAETVRSASALADVSIDAALVWCHRNLAATKSLGEPLDGSGKPQHLVAFALGKLGAHELNLSSDVDLVLAYPEAGETTAGKTCQQFFVRLAQMLIDALDPVTVDGLAFRIDLRLRPYGDSGPLVMHFDAMESYFETQGRDWERYAFIKARACAGDLVSGEAMLRRLTPFVYRRYLDFGALDSLRDMKQRIRAERHGDANIKLGEGGIREVEFGAQVMQLIFGGREPRLRQRGLLAALDALVDTGHIGADEVVPLRQAYVFLRDLEHSLQARADEQTQTLPTDPQQQAQIAAMMGHADYAGLIKTLDQHRAVVRRWFDSVIAPAESVVSTQETENIAWDDVPAAIVAHQLGEAERCAEELIRLRTARDRSSVGHEGRERLDALMPAVLSDLRGAADAGTVLARLTPILGTVLRRSAYLALLRENPGARRLLVDLVRKSRWIAERLFERPMHMDALLDERDIDQLPSTAIQRSAVQERLATVAPDDAERRLDVLREFREQYSFRIALAELREKLTLMRISDYYTFLAEALLQESLDMAWADCSGPAERPFIIVGYGKLGGLELGPGSDLDIVFLHDFKEEHGPWLARFIRRLLHVLTANTYNGPLYSIDTRLRPSGNAGTMVSSLQGFLAYQTERAWTWEQQALVRARCVAGDPGLGERFEAHRRELLCRQRDREKVRRDVIEMRQRMLSHQKVEADLKRSSGGIVDIEFMVQYLVLAHAHEHPELSVWPDNVRILEAAATTGVLPAATASGLTEAYLALRAEAHRRALDLPDRARAEQLLKTHEELVRGTWSNLLG